MDVIFILFHAQSPWKINYWTWYSIAGVQSLFLTQTKIREQLHQFPKNSTNERIFKQSQFRTWLTLVPLHQFKNWKCLDYRPNFGYGPSQKEFDKSTIQKPWSIHVLERLHVKVKLYSLHGTDSQPTKVLLWTVCMTRLIYDLHYNNLTSVSSTPRSLWQLSQTETVKIILNTQTGSILLSTQLLILFELQLTLLTHSRKHWREDLSNSVPLPTLNV